MRNILFGGISLVPKYVPMGKLFNTMAVNCKFTMDKPGRQHLNQVIKFSIIDTGINILYVPPDMHQKGCSIIFVIYLSKMHTLNLTMGEKSDRST